MPGCLAIIPARGGSKRLPRKNIIDFQGRPVITWTIDEAIGCGRFQQVLVSTDDPQTAEIARGAGAGVSIRPPELASDQASLIDVGIDVLDREQQQQRAYDVLCFLYPTAPLRAGSDIIGVLELLEPGVCEFAMAVTRYAHPPHQALVMDSDGSLRPRWPEYIELSEAGFGKVWVDNGSTYAVNTAAFRKHRTFYGPGLRGWPMPFMRSIDIDVPEDLELARCIASGGTP